MPTSAHDPMRGLKVLQKALDQGTIKMDRCERHPDLQVHEDSPLGIRRITYAFIVHGPCSAAVSANYLGCASKPIRARHHTLRELAKPFPEFGWADDAGVTCSRDSAGEVGRLSLLARRPISAPGLGR